MRQTVFEYIEVDTIEPADTAPTDTSARKRLRHDESLNDVSTVGGQDQIRGSVEDTLNTLLEAEADQL